MDEMFIELLDGYKCLLNDLYFGYPITAESLESLWALLHRRQYTILENYNDTNVSNILEYYEYF